MDKQSAVPELLAPAGNLETALAAFDAGADAVYGRARQIQRPRTGPPTFPPPTSGGCLIMRTAGDAGSI